MKIDIGIPENTRKSIADGLAKLLADTYTLYLKTHKFHWNVTGPLFNTLHEMFEKEYLALGEAVDTIAERIRALGFQAPGSFAEFSKLTEIKEETSTPDAMTMLKKLVEGNECVIRTARGMAPKAAEANDEATLDLLTGRLQYHEKASWMLRSMLG